MQLFRQASDKKAEPDMVGSSWVQPSEEEEESDDSEDSTVGDLAKKSGRDSLNWSVSRLFCLFD